MGADSGTHARAAEVRLRIWQRARCRLDRAWLGGLRQVLKFDPWHAAAPYSCRPYKKKVVQLANSLRPSVVVEVGCGLGDILSRVQAPQRFGFDTDAAVIRAARLLHLGRGHWKQGDTAAVNRCVPQKYTIDCLIMVNWIHGLSPAELQACVLPLLPRVGHLILDAIDPGAPPSYRFRHDFDFLSTAAERVRVARVAGEPRSFVVFKVRR